MWCQVVPSEPGWQSIDEEGIRRWRRNLPKGHIRESNSAHTVGYDQVDADGNNVTIDVPSDEIEELDKTNPVTHIAQAAIPREVAEQIYGEIWAWATKNPQAYELMAQIVKHNNPEWSHLSHDELKSKLKEHAQAAARAATEQVYEDNWALPADLDMWQGKPVKM